MLIMVVILCIPVGHSNGIENSAYIEIMETGSIDWAAGVFQASGVGPSPEKKGERDEAEREKALNASKVYTQGFLSDGTVAITLQMNRNSERIPRSLLRGSSICSAVLPN